MGILRDSLSRIFDNGERQALSLLNDAQRAFDNFDFDATVDSIIERSKNAFDGFNDFMKTVKDSVSDFKVIIPFNEKKEKFDINIKDGVITVTVTGKNTHRKTTATIPSNCITDNVNHFVDKKRGNLVVVIPKNVAEDENFKRFKSSVTEKVSTTASWLKDALKEKAESVASSTTPPSSKPKTERKHVGKTKPKVVRGKDGKFVSVHKNKKA